MKRPPAAIRPELPADQDQRGREEVRADNLDSDFNLFRLRSRYFL
jgi:hypothetical protein